MQPTQSDRPEHASVRARQGVGADGEQGGRGDGGDESGKGPGGERRTQLARQAALKEPRELEQRRTADDRKAGAPRNAGRGLRIKPKRPSRRERGTIARNARNKRERLSKPNAKLPRPGEGSDRSAVRGSEGGSGSYL